MEKTPADTISIPAEVRDKMKTLAMLATHREEASGICLPQFMVKTTPNIFFDSTHELLQKEHLADGFTLKDKDLHVNFSSVAAEMARVDVAEGSDTQPRAFRLSGVDNAYFKEWFASLPSAQRIVHCKGMIHAQLSRLDSVEDGELREYIDRVIDTLSQDQLADLEHSPHLFGSCIKGKIQSLLTTHTLSLFDLWMEQGRVCCLPQYKFPETISPVTVSKTLPKSLYEAEEAMNPYEFEVVWAMTSLDNIVWWHRNLSRTGFCINGPVHAYPDIIARTESGKILLVETKGDHLDNAESENKARIGARWANEAGRNYRYFMVFDKRHPSYPGAFSRERFMEIVRGI
jgi:type III restriction enzyme